MGLDSMLFGIVMAAAGAAILFNHGGVYVLGGALAVALVEKIYEEDDDVQTLENKRKIRQVANQG